MKSTQLMRLAKIYGDDSLLMWWKFSRNWHWQGRTDVYHVRSKKRFCAKLDKNTVGRAAKVFDKLCRIEGYFD